MATFNKVLRSIAFAKTLATLLVAEEVGCLATTCARVPGSRRQLANLDPGSWQILSAFLGSVAVNCAAASCKAGISVSVFYQLCQ